MKGICAWPRFEKGATNLFLVNIFFIVSLNQKACKNWWKLWHLRKVKWQRIHRVPSCGTNLSNVTNLQLKLSPFVDFKCLILIPDQLNHHTFCIVIDTRSRLRSRYFSKDVEFIEWRPLWGKKQATTTFLLACADQMVEMNVLFPEKDFFGPNQVTTAMFCSSSSSWPLQFQASRYTNRYRRTVGQSNKMLEGRGSIGAID